MLFEDDEPAIPVIRQLEREEILRRYADGERNFSYCVSLSKDFSGANLSGADFRHAKMIGSSFVNANLKDVNFIGAELALASFHGADIKGANFSLANLTGADFSGTDTSSANFSGAIHGQKKEGSDKKKTTVVNILGEYSRGKRDFSSVAVPNADFRGKKLCGIIFRNAVLQNSNFNYCDLTDADFSGADLMNTWLIGATLRGTVFSRAYMYFATMRNAIVENTSFENADMSWNDLSGVNLASAKISGTILSWCIIDGSKMSDDQFFRLSPEVARTIKFVSAETGSSFTKASGKVTGKEDMGSYALPDDPRLAYGLHEDNSPGYRPHTGSASYPAPGGSMAGPGTMYKPAGGHDAYALPDKKKDRYGLR